MSERLISRANRAMPSDSLASDCWNRSCALVRNTFCTSIAIGWVSGRLPAMSVNKKTTREPIAIASKKSPPHRVEWYRALRSMLSICGKLAGRGDEPGRSDGDPDSEKDESIPISLSSMVLPTTALGGALLNWLQTVPLHGRGPEIKARLLPLVTVSATLTQAVQVIEGPIAQRLEQGTHDPHPAISPDFALFRFR